MLLRLLPLLIALAGNAIFSPSAPAAGSPSAPLRLSSTIMPVSAPLLLARELGWFQKAGLNVQIKEYALGKIALEDMEKGELDLAFAAVTPLIYKRLANDDFRILATVAASTSMVAIVARKDRGISQITHLAGKRVGVSMGTSGEFFFDTMRVLHRLPAGSVNIQDCSVPALIAGMQDGSLDAGSLWETHIARLQRAMPGQFQFFYANGLYEFSWNLVALPATISARRGEIEKVLRVLFDVAHFIETKPAAARGLLVSRLGPDGQDFAARLAETRFRPHLSQSLLVQLEAETRWVLSRDGKPGPVPNYLRSVDSSILKAVRPAAVTLIQ